jgi:hypothetical protein
VFVDGPDESSNDSFDSEMTEILTESEVDTKEANNSD